ncbi:MAG: hypothetical protein MHM6MM_006852 [Cercozoa sp. M6MM]
MSQEIPFEDAEILAELANDACATAVQEQRESEALITAISAVRRFHASVIERTQPVTGQREEVRQSGIQQMQRLLLELSKPPCPVDEEAKAPEAPNTPPTDIPSSGVSTHSLLSTESEDSFMDDDFEEESQAEQPSVQDESFENESCKDKTVARVIDTATTVTTTLLVLAMMVSLRTFQSALAAVTRF